MLDVIGTGFGRTGTNSLKLALELLGFGPCHHMFEIRDHPEQLPLWESAAKGGEVDWDVVFAGYSSCVDWPAAHYWRELCCKYPKAKVIHSVRDEEKWITSVHNTILPTILNRDQLEEGQDRNRHNMSFEIILNQTFDGRLDDREHAINVFRAHNKEVSRTVPAERLLVYDVNQGWEPLCNFLGVSVPETPFPRQNTSAEFQKSH